MYTHAVSLADKNSINGGDHATTVVTHNKNVNHVIHVYNTREVTRISGTARVWIWEGHPKVFLLYSV